MILLHLREYFWIIFIQILFAKFRHSSRVNKNTSNNRTIIVVSNLKTKITIKVNTV